ncbi:oligosaccharide flippase family protein [uncultured Cedecea sp.]|uniref:oligosaccharide flippase family protein n=1 Tax=uncultured Cedecea sp. TaxID=988762 RepID=UPI00260C6A0A|nr:oligosaccharide flippase family protein [uncultured Cedecea sp.]
MLNIKNNYLIKLLMSTFIAKVFVSFGGILLSFVISRLYGVDVLGDFFIFQISVITISVILSLGMNETIVLFVSKYIKEVDISLYLKYSIILSGLLFLLFSLITSLLNINFLPSSYKVIASNKYLFLISIYSCLINTLLSGFMRGVKKPAYSVLLENGVVAIISIIIIALNSLLTNNSDINIAYMYCYSSAIVTLFCLYKFKTKFSSTLRKPNKDEIRSFFRKNWSFYSMVLCGLVSTSFISLYLGYKLDSEDVALFRVMQQVCTLISFSLIILNAVMPAYISGLFTENSLKKIENISIKTSIYATLLSLPIYLVCIIFPAEIFSYFNINANSLSLIILASAQLFNVSTGSVASVLKMCGLERELNYIIISTSFISLSVLVILTPIYGVLGAVIASSCILIIQNFLSLILVKLKLGISTVFYIWRSPREV